MFFIMISASLADSNVYITQSGANLDLDITMDGNNNAIGASNDRTLLTGANLDVDIDLIGASNVITGDFIGAGESGADDLKINQTGSTNTTALNIGSSAATDDVSIIENRIGSSGVTSYLVGSAATVQDVSITVDVVGDDIDIGLDAHAKIFEPIRALELADAMAPYKPYFFEEPIRPENIQAMAYLRRKMTIPLATGECLYTKFQFNELMQAQAADIIQPDVCICGGLLALRKIAAIAGFDQLLLRSGAIHINAF